MKINSLEVAYNLFRGNLLIAVTIPIMEILNLIWTPFPRA